MLLWSSQSESTTVGAPTNNGYIYLVNRINSSTINIVAYCFDGSNNPKIYLLTRYGDTWGTWLPLTNYYLPGDTVTISAYKAIGRVVNAGNGLYVQVNLPMAIKASSCAVTNVSGTIFGLTNAHTGTFTVSNIGYQPNGTVVFVISLATSETAGTVGLAEIAATITFS